MTYERNQYVTLRSFCKFYKFQYPKNAMDDNEVTIKNNEFTITFRKGSQNIWINQARHWTSLDVERTDEDWIIARKDLSKLFEPILRPSSIPDWQEWKGVVIDPGHGGSDRGAISRKGKNEKDYALDTGLRLERLLKSQGIKTVMTRRTDVFIELEDRARIANRYKDHIFVSLHYNSAKASARGIETYCFPPLGAGSTQYEGRVFRRDKEKMPGNQNDFSNILLASLIHRQIVTLNSGDEEADRGVKRARFVVLKETQIPAVLIEGGFLSNRQEAARVDTVAFRQSLAEKIALGIQLFMNRGGLPSVAPLSKPNVTTPSAPPQRSTNQPSMTKPTLNPPSTNSVPVLPLNLKSVDGEALKKIVPVVPSVPPASDSFTNLQSTNWVTPAVLPPVPIAPESTSPSVSPPAPAEQSNPTIPSPNISEEKSPSSSENSVEIYMQIPQTRVPQVDLRKEEVSPSETPTQEKRP